MHFLTIICLLLSAFSLHAAPIKVPTERYAGSIDKRGHPGHYPFISYLTFRNMCDISIDDATEYFDPDTVKYGDTIYLNIWYLDWFVAHVHDKIRFPYILVTADVGAWVPHPSLKKLLYDPKLAAWFCRNMVFSYHPKLFQIPTGQDLAQFVVEDYNIMNNLLDALPKRNLPKKHLLYMCHYPRTFGERDKIVKMFEDKPWCLAKTRSINYAGVPRDIYYDDIAASKFVLSPLGLETDSVRTWEAIVLNCIPIVEHTFLDASYDNLPVMMVHDWNDITPELLGKAYPKLKDKNREEAYFDYWRDLIKSTQIKVRRGDNFFSKLEGAKIPQQEVDDLSYVLQKDKREDRQLIYKGFFSSIRPLQLAQALTFLPGLYVADPWCDKLILLDFQKYLKNYDLDYANNKRRIWLLDDDNHFLSVVRTNPGCSVFLDFSFYRTSLFIDFHTSTIGYGNFRQSLKQDLQHLYNNLTPDSLLCGNMRTNEYVNEILEMFSQENGLEIGSQGSIWFLRKK